MILAIQPNARPTWQPIDDHGTHAMIVDEFLADPDGLRDLACTLAYQPPSAPDNYPGLKAYTSVPGTDALKTWIADRVLERLYPAGRPPAFRTKEFDAYGAFCVFACDRSRLPTDLEDQHTDGFAWLAAVLHLSRNDEGRGTGMWEHRASGLQQWLAADAVRLAGIERTLGLRLSAQLARASARVPLLSAADVQRLFRTRGARRAFTTDEDDEWRLTAYVPARWNRLVVYPTWQIHSVIDASGIEEPTLDTARLTFNFMIEYPIPRELTRSRAPYPASFYRRVKGLL